MTIKNLAMGIVVTPPTPAASGTTATVRTGEGAFFGTVFPFLATTAPPDQLSNPAYAEIILVTGISGDTLTFVRTKRGTTGQPIAAGWIIANGIYVEDVQGIPVTVATAAATAAKVGTTAEADYVPALGDRVLVTFSSGMNVNTATLNIDGSGAKNIRVGNVNVTTALFSTTSAVTVPMWYDGTYFQLYGSYLNTTYAEISDANLQATAGTTTGLITGRRMEAYKNANLIIDEDNMASDLATKMPSQQSVKAYVDSKSINSWVFNETPSGTPNGVLTSFTLTQSPTNIILTRNGQLLKPGVGNDYTISGNTITMFFAPLTGDQLLATYTVGSTTFLSGSNSLRWNEPVTGTIDGTNKAFTTAAPYIGGSLTVMVNGLVQKPVTHYVETTPTTGVFTFDDAPVTGDVITVTYQSVASVTGNSDTVDGIHASSTPTANMLMPLGADARFPASVNPLSAFTGRHSSAVAVANGVWTKIPIQTEIIKVGGDITHAANSADIVIVNAGYYSLMGNVRLATATSARTFIQLGINGTTSDPVSVVGSNAANNGAGGLMQLISTPIVYLNAGDVVALWILQDTGSSFNTLPNASTQGQTIAVMRVA